MKKKTVTISEEMVSWVESKIEDCTFSSLSHAVQKALYELKKSYEDK